MPDPDKSSSSEDYINPPAARERPEYVAFDPPLAPVGRNQEYGVHLHSSDTVDDANLENHPQPEPYSERSNPADLPPYSGSPSVGATKEGHRPQPGLHLENSDPADLPPSYSQRPSVDAADVGNRPQPGPTSIGRTRGVSLRAALTQRVSRALPAWMRRDRAANMDNRPQPGPPPERSNPRDLPPSYFEATGIEGAPHLEVARPASPLFREGEIDRLFDTVRDRVAAQMAAQAGRGNEDLPPYSPQRPEDAANMDNRSQSGARLGNSGPGDSPPSYFESRGAEGAPRADYASREGERDRSQIRGR